MPILDCHTHHPAPQPEGIISLSPEEFTALDSLPEEQLYSVGIHPWTTLQAPTTDINKEMERALASKQVVAIGECGIDTLRGGPMFRQLQILKMQIDLSEQSGLPLLLHDVKAHDVLTGLRRDLQPRQPWIIHGFRGKPTVAKMLLDAGMYLSFGEKFNPEALSVVPVGRLLAETDESSLTIEEIIKALSASAGRDLTEEIATASRTLFNR